STPTRGTASAGRPTARTSCAAPWPGSAPTTRPRPRPTEAGRRPDDPGGRRAIRRPRDRDPAGPADGGRLSGPAGHPLRAGLRAAGGRALGRALAAELYRVVHGRRRRL